MGAPAQPATGFARLLRQSDVLLAVVMATILGVMIVPLPEFVLDALIIVNVAAALTMLLVAMYTTHPLQFSSFPALLLMLTLFRLALNVAASRLILLQGHAGEVIAAFGNFVVGGNYVVGVVIFLILIVIQFVVITNGAGRVAEVAARFTLDSMPGKQMAIDADLSAGAIDEATARARRKAVEQEADFYGSMDGASKFVKGDAVAGVIIIIVNIIGGLTIGVLQLGMPITRALGNYTLLTVGDGLISQIPALLISTATGLIVTRSASDSNLGNDIGRQVLGNPRALYMVSGVLVALAIVPGLPKLPLFTIAAALSGLGLFIQRRATAIRAEDEAAVAAQAVQQAASVTSEPENVRQFLRVDPMEIEIGYMLIPLTDPEQDGTLLGRVTVIRRQMALELGIVLPTIRVRDNAQIDPNSYAIKLRGVQVATGEVRPNRLMAMNPGLAEQEIDGIPAVEPAFGLPAIWIASQDQERAEMLGYTVVDPASVITTHLSEVIRASAASILSRQDVQSLLDHVKEEHPALINEVVPDLLTLGDVQRVLQNLLRERVSVRDLVTILEAIADQARVTKDADVLAEYARVALGRQITGQYLGEDIRLHVMTLAPALQHELTRTLVATERGPSFQLEPGQAQQLMRGVREGMERMASAGYQPVLLAPARIRLAVRRFTELSLASLVVMSYSEVSQHAQVVAMEMVNVPGVEV
ncbi:MAG: flagellar biosynthesis protein FlhA [Chloroflexi bacterium]|nr:flagellar biosynthesis protein FlhA [Chloroflexota bacterium]